MDRVLTESGVRELVQLYDAGEDLLSLAERYGVTRATVSRIITGHTWTHITGGVNRSRAGQATECRVAYIESRLRDGCRSPAIIGRELGISRQAVSKLIKTRGLGGRKC